MSTVVIKLGVTGEAEIRRALQQLGESAQAVGGKVERSTQSFRTFHSSARDLTQALAGVAAIASIMARNNPELQRQLEILSLTTSGASTALRGLNSVLRLVIGAIGVKIAVLGGLVTAVVVLIRHWEAAREAAARIWGGIRDFFVRLGEGFGNLFRGLGQIIVGFFTRDLERMRAGQAQLAEGLGQLKGAAIDLGTGIKNLVIAGWEKLTDFFGKTGKAAKKLKEDVTPVLDPGFIAMMKTFGEALGGMASEAERAAGRLGKSTAAMAAAVKSVLDVVRAEGTRELGLLVESAEALGGHAAIAFLMEFGGKLVEQGKITGDQLKAALKPFLAGIAEDAPAVVEEGWKTTFEQLGEHLTAFGREGIEVADRIATAIGVDAAIVFLNSWRQSLEEAGRLTDEAAEAINQALIRLFAKPPAIDSVTKTLKSIGESLQSSLTTAFMNILAEGKDVFESLADAARTFFNEVARQLLSLGVGKLLRFLLPTLFGLERGGIIPALAGGGLIPAFATGGVHGGIVTEPTFLVGEGKRAEAVVPLPDNRSIPVRFQNEPTKPQEREIKLWINLVVDPNDLRQPPDPNMVAATVAANIRHGGVIYQTIRKAMP